MSDLNPIASRAVEVDTTQPANNAVIKPAIGKMRSVDVLRNDSNSTALPLASWKKGMPPQGRQVLKKRSRTTSPCAFVADTCESALATPIRKMTSPRPAAAKKRLLPFDCSSTHLVDVSSRAIDEVIAAKNASRKKNRPKMGHCVKP